MKPNQHINAQDITILTIGFYRLESLPDDDGDVSECWTASIVSNECVQVTGTPADNKALALGNLFSDLAFYSGELNFFFHQSSF